MDSASRPPNPRRTSSARIPVEDLLNPTPHSQQDSSSPTRIPALSLERDSRGARRVLPGFSSFNYPPYASGSSSSMSDGPEHINSNCNRSRSHSCSASLHISDTTMGSRDAPVSLSQRGHQALEGGHREHDIRGQRDNYRDRAVEGTLTTLFLPKYALTFLLHSSRSMMASRWVIGRVKTPFTLTFRLPQILQRTDRVPI